MQVGAFPPASTGVTPIFTRLFRSTRGPCAPSSRKTRFVLPAVIGYEYTTMGGNNLHRNVIFRGDSSVAHQTVPLSQFDIQNPEDLWRSLAEFQKQTGAEVLAIPHNGILSNGRMFSVNKFDGKTPYDKELAELRARLEPIYEATKSSFYYSRVMEIPTPRWTAYEARRFNIKTDKKVSMITAERAYTSPI